MKTKFLLLLVLCLGSFQAHAWGRRGHALVCETAALILKDEAAFLNSSAFDLGYYCNVPDIIWKKGDLYKQEWFNHFMDLEVFDRALRGSSVSHPFDLDRVEFNRRFPNIKNDAGRAWWRIRELNETLGDVAKKLRTFKGEPAEQHQLQAEWLVLAGAIGHYVGDLAQPLHVTENFDGELTKQKGIHSFFEDRLVDELYSRGELTAEVLKLATEQFHAQRKAVASQSLDDLDRNLSEDSMRELPGLLKLDHEIGRQDLQKAATRFHSLLVDRLAKGAVTVAELWRRQLGWRFDHHRFYNFEGTPAYIAAPTEPSKAPPKAQ